MRPPRDSNSKVARAPTLRVVDEFGSPEFGAWWAGDAH